MRFLLVPKLEIVDKFNSLTVCPMMLVKAMLMQTNARFVIAVHEDFAKDRSWLSRYWLTEAEQTRVKLLPLSKGLVGDSSRPKKLGHIIGNALFNQIGPLSEECRYIDAIIADGVFASHASLRVAAQGTYPRGMQRKIPLVAWAEMVVSVNWGSWIFNEYDAIAHTFGAIWADKIIWQSKYVENDFLEGLRKWANPRYISNVLDRAVSIPSGIMCDRLYPRGPYDPSKKPVALWSGYWDEDFRDCVPAMVEAYKMGILSKLIIHVMPQFAPIDPKALDSLRKIDGVELYEHMPQDEYFKMMAKADIFVATAKAHTYGLRYGEMIASNVFPLVGPDLKTNFLPSDWKFTLKEPSKIPQYLMATADYLSKNPNAGVDIGAKVRAEHDYLVCFKKFHDVCQDTVNAEKAVTNYGDFLKLAKIALTGVQSIGHATAIEAIRNLTDSKGDLRANMLVPPGFLRWAIEAAGYRDTCEGWEPTYEKV